MKYHILAFFFGFILDLLFGDPYFLPHPIRLIGKLITGLEKRLRGGQSKVEKRIQFRRGIWLVIIVLAAVVSVTWALLFLSYRVHPYMGLIVETVMTYQILAVKCLKVESMKVYRCLRDGDTEKAREAVSMIVGRDTEGLDEEGIAKAAIETVAENTSDGVIAPMLYTALGGPVLGFFYKAVNTMDSMIGYQNKTYLYFGRAAARLDDLVNFIPARISACFMIASTFLLEKNIFAKKSAKTPDCGTCVFSYKRAVIIYKRDRRKHASPNSAQTESVCAGALGIRLAGDAVYFGQRVIKPYIGDAGRNVEYEDIRRADRLLYVSAWSCEIVCLALLVILYIR
ncbi:MAG: adenosylcobinamide-phosphate synthase CbiB [Roseburia sp.]|nr:adenosylcobinamide-phosphate synthase CbiB [Roseburia sp.]MCM1241792.1 adenosylcobinamide-phosphate synthase CbiB [Roseburia sp.]